MFLKNTVEDVLANVRAETEVIVILDGAPAVEPLVQHDRLTVVILPESIGQRAATNMAARLSDAKYVMKLDAHCTVAPGFDVELIKTAKELGRDVTQIPLQYNLHAFDWVCDACQNRTYQGPTPAKCAKCEAPSPRREMVWKPRERRKTTAWRFDSELHFQYFPEWGKRPEGQGEIADTMSCLGACWFLERARYWELGGMDEQHGSWGQMGTELSCKSWLSGGKMVTNKRTWFSHMFRTQGGDFSFPYELRGRDVDKARKHSQNLWRGNKWSGQVRPLSWLVEHFWPVPGWSSEVFEALRAEGLAFDQGRVAPLRSDNPVSASSAPAPSETEPTNFVGRMIAQHAGGKGAVYYTDNRGDEKILRACREQLRIAVGRYPITSVSLEPIVNWVPNEIVLPLERGYLTMAKQILAGVEAVDADIVFFTEHDVLYHPSHFEFTPTKHDRVYYNQNVWKVNAENGHALFYYCNQLSGLCAFRDTLLDHYTKRVELIEKNGFSRKMGFEPGTHNRAERVDDLKHETWMSSQPNVDIRHGSNLTPTRWRKDQFRDQRYTRGWTEADVVPGWGRYGVDFLV
jgi:hypothetical protein